MIIIKSEFPIPIDVDGTLVLEANAENRALGLKVISVKDPLTGGMLTMCAHEPNIRLIKEEHSRGSYLMVWSRGGYAWAAAVVVALNLQDIVNEVMTKPHVYIDDVDVKEWMPSRVYLPPNSRYKK